MSILKKMHGERLLVGNTCLLGVESVDSDDLARMMGDRLSELTMEQGATLPVGARIQRYEVRRLGWFQVGELKEVGVRSVRI